MTVSELKRRISSMEEFDSSVLLALISDWSAMRGALVQIAKFYDVLDGDAADTLANLNLKP